jgi:hypothetical protein
VTIWPKYVLAGLTPIEVVVEPREVKLAVPAEPEKLVSPEYVTVRVLVPSGAPLEAHWAWPELSEMLAQSVVPPKAKLTVPVGVPVEPLVLSATVAV